MPGFPPRSQRKVAGPAGLSAAVVLLAACSLLAPATFAPQQSVAEATDAPTPSPRLTASPSSSPTEAIPTIPPSQPPAAVWHAIVPPLTHPAAWLDFGFASNGDVLAIGTRNAGAKSLRLFVARFSPTGKERARHDLARRVTPIAGDWAAIDPTDNSIVIDDYSTSKYEFTLRRFSSSTGANLSNVHAAGGITRLAIDGRGHRFGLPQYGVGGDPYAAIVRLDARGRVRAGVDYWLRALTAGPRPVVPGILAFPTAIAIGGDGRVIIVDEPDVDATYPDGTPRTAAVVTSLGADLSSPRQWELPVEYPLGSAAFETWSHRLTIAGAADGSVYVGEPRLDATRATIVGWRVRELSPEGDLVDSWGSDAPASGVVHPTHPAVDAAGRLWVIDTDPATGITTIAVLSLPA